MLVIHLVDLKSARSFDDTSLLLFSCRAQVWRFPYLSSLGPLILPPLRPLSRFILNMFNVCLCCGPVDSLSVDITPNPMMSLCPRSPAQVFAIPWILSKYVLSGWMNERVRWPPRNPSNPAYALPERLSRCSLLMVNLIPLSVFSWHAFFWEIMTDIYKSWWKDHSRFVARSSCRSFLWPCLSS